MINFGKNLLDRKGLIVLQPTDVGNVAEWVKASFLRQPQSNDLGSTRTLVTLLRPWMRRFTMIISA